jgi:heme oxygenase
MVIPSIQQRLKDETQELHTAAEEHPLMKSFKDGTYKKIHLIQYLSNLRPVYETVEQKLLIPYIHKNFDLCRSRLISKDIAMLYKEGVVDSNIDKLIPLSCTSKWVSSQWLINTNYLAADLYVRWLADFYGGRVFANTLAPYVNTFISNDAKSVIETVRNVIETHSSKDKDINTFSTQDAIVSRAKEFFKFHIELFDQIYE